MAKNDWFRKTTWAETDQADFYARLERARPPNRAQYLRIQAGYLQGAGFVRESIALLDQMLEGFPDSFDRAQALLQKAECLDHLGCLDEAITFYRTALQREREFRNAGTGAWLAFGWTVVQHKLSRLYSEAIAVLEEFSTRLLFESDKYRMNAIRAIIAKERGDSYAARAFAQQALHATSQGHSGFRYHPTVGLIGKSDKTGEIIASLERLAQAS